MERTYKDYGGVDISLGDKISSTAQEFGKTTKKDFEKFQGDFAAVFNLKDHGLKNTNIVTCADGVGTKVKLAQKMNSHFNLGQDLVAMCVNDLLCHGARPIMFLDYISMGKLEEKICQEILAGITTACNEVKCWLAGGETAEMPGLYKRDSEYDLAGFAIGIVKDEDFIPKEQKGGDVLIGISSSGVHSNGFSLIRQIIKENRIDIVNEKMEDNSSRNLSNELLTPTVLYNYVLDTIDFQYVKGIAHITGGGIRHNLGRILSNGMTASIDTQSWPVSSIFEWIRVKGEIDNREMFNIFNMGIGLVLIVSKEHSEEILTSLNKVRPSYEIGHLEENYSKVDLNFG